MQNHSNRKLTLRGKDYEKKQKRHLSLLLLIQLIKLPGLYPTHCIPKIFQWDRGQNRWTGGWAWGRIRTKNGVNVPGSRDLGED